jgi:hypothetical protein
MFYVDKNTVPRYWSAYAGKVEERVGECLGNQGEFLTERAAVTYADHRMQDRLADELSQIKRRYSSVYLAVCRIRALWNSQIRDGLNRYYAERHDATINALVPPITKIKSVPDQIPVLGERLAIGTTVYMVDNHDAELRVGKVTAEHIRYYDFRPAGVEAYYELDNRMSIQSTLKSSYSNQEIYLDKDEAISRIRELIQDKVRDLQQQLETL